MKARTPSIVVFSTLTFIRSRMPGTFFMMRLRACFGDRLPFLTGFGQHVPVGPQRRADDLFSCGLTVDGTGMVFAGTASPDGAAVWAIAPVEQGKVAARYVRQVAARAWLKKCGDFFIGRLSRFLTFLGI